MAHEGYTIGQLARAAGVSVETVRYYQKRGLIKEPVKPPYGFRYYSETTLRRLRFIRSAKRLGFTLKEIRELLQISDGSCEDVRDLAAKKCEHMRHQLTELSNMLAALEQLVADCDRPHRPEHCPLIDAVSANAPLYASAAPSSQGTIKGYQASAAGSEVL